MRGIHLFFAGLMAIAGPVFGQSKHIHEDIDPYTGLKTLSLEVSSKTCPGDRSQDSGDPDLHLLFVAEQNQNNTLSYYVISELDGGAYKLAVPRNGTMDTLIDGDVLTLSTNTGGTSIKRQSELRERIPFSVAGADLERLSRAQSFQFRINGRSQGLQRCTDAKRMRDLPEFLQAAKAYDLAEPGSTFVRPTLVEGFDSSRKLKTLSLENIPTEPCPGSPALGPGDADVQLVISASQRSDGGVWYYLSTDLSNGAPLGLHRGDKLHTQIGGVSGAFNTINGSVLTSRTDLRGQPIWHERTAFHVHQGDLVPLTNSPMLEVHVQGMNGELHRCASADKFQHVGEFINIAATYHSAH